MPARIRSAVSGAADQIGTMLVVVIALLIVGCSAPVDDRAEAADVTSPRAVEGSSPSDVGSPGDTDHGSDGIGRDDHDPARRRIRMAVVGMIATDPLAASPVDPADMAVLDLLYEGLTRWDEGEEAPVPALATSIEVGRGARRWTFRLGDRRFSDGRVIDAGDVVAALDRVRAGSSLASDRLDHVRSIRAVDPATVEVRLSRPDASFDALLSHPIYGIAPSHTLELDGRVSSGPLQLSTKAEGLLVPVEMAGDSRAEVDVEVELLLVDDVAGGVDLVESRAADLVYVPPGFRGPANRSTPSGVVTAFALNAASPRLAAVLGRRALVDVVDDRPVAAVLTGVEAIDDDPSDRLDPTRTEDLPPALTLTFIGDGVGSAEAEAAMAVALAAQWEDAGVDVRLEDLSLEAFVSLVAVGAHDIVRTGWVEFFPGDRARWRLVDPASLDNVTGVRDERLERLISRATASGEAAAIASVEARIDALAVLVPVARLEVRAIAGPDLAGITLRPDGSLAIAPR